MREEYTYLLLLCFLFLFCFIYKLGIEKKEPFFITFDKIPLWTYNNKEKYDDNYFELFLESFNKYNDQYFEIIVLDDNLVHRYINNLPNNFTKLDYDLKINLIKFNLLYNYGGLWVDCNTIIFDNLKLFTDKLIQYDFIGFGCKEPYCDNNSYYSRPILNIMGCRKNSIFLKILNEKILEVVKSKNKTININNLVNTTLSHLISQNNYEYYHFDPKYIGYIDNENNIITDSILNSNNKLEYDKDTKLVLINTIKKIGTSIDDILSQNDNISMSFRKSLYPEHPYHNEPTIINKDVDVYALYIPKREVYIMENLNKIFLNSKFFKGFNKNDLNEDELVKNEYISKEWTLDPKFNFGRVACHMGHIAILKTFLETDQKYALILEDDIYIDLSKLNYYRNRLSYILNNIPPNAQIVYLSFCWEKCSKLKQYDEKNIFLKSYRPLCRHIYLVSRDGARIIINNTKNLKKPGDNTIATLIEDRKLLSYSVNPEFFILNQNRQVLGSNLGNSHHYRVCTKSLKYTDPKKQ